MKREEILQLATEYVKNSHFNNIGPHTPDAENYFGLHVFDDPIMGITTTDDPYWQEMLKPEAIGPQFIRPQEWLNGSKSVVCFFLPISKEIKKFGRMSHENIRKEWLFARTDANWVIMSMCDYIVSKMEEAGYKCVIPQKDSRYMVRTGYYNPPDHASIATRPLMKGRRADYEAEEAASKDKHEFPSFNSNWSERHAGYACGLGTFGLGANIITRVGTAGRLVSFITDWEADAYDTRPYTEIYEYCTRCGVCVARCPGDAISLETGKDKRQCHLYYTSMGYQLVPRYHCGTCMAGVPCQDGIPTKSF